MLIIPHYSNNFFTIFTSYTFRYVPLESIFTPIHSLCPTKGYKYVSIVFFYQSIHYVQQWQVGGLDHVLFFHILGIRWTTDFHIFQRGRYTTNQMGYVSIPMGYISVNLDQICEY